MARRSSTGCVLSKETLVKLLMYVKTLPDMNWQRQQMKTKAMQDQRIIDLHFTADLDDLENLNEKPTAY